MSTSTNTSVVSATRGSIATKLLAAFAGILFFTALNSAQAAHFVKPKWNGYALDWCLNFEQSCGKPAADMFCKKNGYPQSIGFVRVGPVNYQTMTIGQNAICNPSVHRCDSFASITCLETVKTFNYPSHNGYRLDWCKHFETDCGAPAALAYCHKQGFSSLVSFQKQGPLAVQTMTVASNAICNPKYHRCDGFSYVRCKK